MARRKLRRINTGLSFSSANWRGVGLERRDQRGVREPFGKHWRKPRPPQNQKALKLRQSGNEGFLEFQRKTVRWTGLILLFGGEVDPVKLGRWAMSPQDRDERKQAGILTSGFESCFRLPNRVRPVALETCIPLQWRDRLRLSRSSPSLDCVAGWRTILAYQRTDHLLRLLAKQAK